MGKISEQSFADRLARARVLQSKLASLPNYKPELQQCTRDGFQDLINQTDGANSNVASMQTYLKDKIEIKNDFLRSDLGLIELSRKIRDNVGSMMAAGKESSEFKLIQAECQKMINYKKKPKDVVPPPNAPTTLVEKKTRSTAQMGDANIIQYAKNIFEVIKTIPNYSSPNNLLTIGGFEDRIAQSGSSINELNNGYNNYEAAVDDRINKYEGNLGIKDVMQRITDYCGYHYGRKSDIFINIDKINY